jgi:hypothetical protein
MKRRDKALSRDFHTDKIEARFLQFLTLPIQFTKNLSLKEEHNSKVQAPDYSKSSFGGSLSPKGEIRPRNLSVNVH